MILKINKEVLLQEDRNYINNMFARTAIIGGGGALAYHFLKPKNSQDQSSPTTSDLPPSTHEKNEMSEELKKEFEKIEDSRVDPNDYFNESDLTWADKTAVAGGLGLGIGAGILAHDGMDAILPNVPYHENPFAYNLINKTNAIGTAIGGVAGGIIGGSLIHQTISPNKKTNKI